MKVGKDMGMVEGAVIRIHVGPGNSKKKKDMYLATGLMWTDHPGWLEVYTLGLSESVKGLSRWHGRHSTIEMCVGGWSFLLL